MKKRKNIKSSIKVRGALETIKGDRTVSELVSQCSVHTTQTSQWIKALLDGAWKVLRGHKSSPENYIDQIKDLHAKIRELTVGRDFLSKKLKL